MSPMMRATTDNGLLAPVPDADGAPFWDFAARGELRIQICSDCREPRFPPRPCCPKCHSFTSSWRLTSGTGHIWSYVRPHPPLLPGYAAHAPYNVVLVELADAPGIRLVGNLVASPDAEIDSAAPEDLRIGAAVRAVFPRVQGMALPRWTPERS